MKTIQQATNDIKELRIQGANQIALYGLSYLRNISVRHGFGKKFRAAARILEGARPTAVVLHNCIEIVKSNPRTSTFDSLIDALRTVGGRESIYADKIIDNNSKIITYCHSGEAMAFIKHAWTTHHKKISVLACKTEPRGQGIKTAMELAKGKIPVTLIEDNAIGFFIKDVDMVIVGADALRKDGVINKIGTSLLALAASNASKPFYVVANSLKIDRRKTFRIEERPTLEIRKTIPSRLTGIKVRNPAFDITLWNHVTRIINEDGIFAIDRFVRLL
ncbi:MAG: hypothetical protein KGI33_11020 [Thaumarchaeota archaeon]|nr:hypothetical protein [Nitrososphaerota archaeon]